MDVKLNANSGIRPAYYGKQPCARKAKASSVSAGQKKDSVEISPEGRELHSRARLLKEMEERYGPVRRRNRLLRLLPGRI